MQIVKRAVAGTMESSDAYIELEPFADGIEIAYESPVAGQFGDAIESAAREVLMQCGVTGAKLFIRDRGALDCVLRARIETAIRRGGLI